MEVDELHGPWLEEVRGIPIVPPGPTCWQAEEGSCLDYVTAAPNLDTKLGEARVTTEAALYPHYPVHVELAKVEGVDHIRVVVEPRGVGA
eukprot:6613094-Pyramimonas_sp.AAC.1